MTSSDLVTFSGGFVASVAVIQKLIDLEAKGCSFELHDTGGFRVIPVSLLNEFDISFLRNRRDEVRQVLEYQEELLSRPD